MKRLHYFISAEGEDADNLAAELVLALRERAAVAHPYAVAGPAMLRAGAVPLADMAHIASPGRGLAQAARHRLLETSLAETLQRLAPRVAILVGYGPFHRRLVDALALRNIPVLIYGAGAFHENDAASLAALRGKIRAAMAIYPFEKPLLAAAGLPHHWIGTPMRDRASKVMVAPEVLGLAPRKPIFAFIPGHEATGDKTSFFHMRAVAASLLEAVPSAQVVFSFPAAWHDDVTTWLGPDARRLDLGTEGVPREAFAAYRWHEQIFVLGMPWEVMRMANVALVGAGTSSLVCALLGTPMIVMRGDAHGHRPSTVNATIGQDAVPEVSFGEGATAIAAALVSLVRDDAAAQSQRAVFAGMGETLGQFSMDQAVEPAMEWLATGRQRRR